jgi:hypothetical protein
MKLRWFQRVAFFFSFFRLVCVATMNVYQRAPGPGRCNHHAIMPKIVLK